MEKQQTSSRKKFLLWSGAILSAITLSKFIPWKKKDKTPGETVKMLTQDGKLVEIEKKLLVSRGTNISNEELQNWIKK